MKNNCNMLGMFYFDFWFFYIFDYKLVLNKELFMMFYLIIFFFIL